MSLKFDYKELESILIIRHFTLVHIYKYLNNSNLKRSKCAHVIVGNSASAYWTPLPTSTMVLKHSLGIEFYLNDWAPESIGVFYWFGMPASVLGHWGAVGAFGEILWGLVDVRHDWAEWINRLIRLVMTGWLSKSEIVKITSVKSNARMYIVIIIKRYLFWLQIYCLQWPN